MDRIELLYVMKEIEAKKPEGRHFQKATFRRCCHTLRLRKLMFTFSLEQQRFHLTYHYPDIAELDVISKKLRAELSNQPLERIELKERDRIVALHFPTKELRIDLVRKNIGIFEEGQQKWSLHGKWAEPKPLSFDPSLPAGLMLGRALGGKYVSDLLSIAGVEKDESLSPERAEKALATFLEKAQPYWRGDEYRLFLTPLEGWERAESLSEAIDRALTKPLMDERSLQKWRKSLEAVERSIKERKAKAAEMRKKGDAIYTHYLEVEDIIALAKAGKWDELQKKYKVRAINKAEKWVEVEFDEEKD